MKIQDISKLYGRLPQTGAFLKLEEDSSIRTVFLQGLVSSAVPLFFSALAGKAVAGTVSSSSTSSVSLPTVLFVLNDADEAGYFYHDLTQIMGDSDVLFFPSAYRRAIKYGQRESSNEILRTEVLARVAEIRSSDGRKEGKDASSRKPPLFIVTYSDALAELVVGRSHLNDHRISLKTGQTVDIMDLGRRMRGLGFTQVDYVYEPGQFAIRGSIVDVYSFSSELPYRVDFFGDEIDTIRTFTVEDQLSKERRMEIEIVPELAEMESVRVPFLHYLPDDTLLVMRDFAYVRDVITRIYDDGFSPQALQERMEGATEQEQAAIRQEMNRDARLCKPTQFVADASRLRQVFFGPDGKALQEAAQATIAFHLSLQPVFHKNFDLLTRSLEDYLLMGYHIYILADSEKQQQRLKDIFDNRDADRERAPHDRQRGTITFTPVDHTLHEGFTDRDLKCCFFTDHQIFDRFHKYSLKSDKARQGKMALTMKELQEMEVGDYIVHVDYGIGKFGGLVRIPIQRAPGQPADPSRQYQEVIRIIYKNNDKVDISIHSLYKISKYRRSDTDEPPRLSALGTGAWERMKEKAKKRIKDIARDLIRLYAKRRHEKGFAYSPDGVEQHELEASFLYEDTPDQLKATQDVKSDMESSRPMDRLICGDVGFGKTEVAIRAAFKAAQDLKQVAVLVPTTVLAWQHYQTFRNRLKGFNVNVDYLTRAKTARQTKQTLADLESGKTDIIIGTHKLLGKSVKWHDIGLLIIDEEQKFGVAVKEKLRKLRTNIDTLTLSATPIPRTLQFSLMGARDMSIMRTPPPNRYPIHTELCSFSHEVIADAINFEMSRNGQVFFVNDRISSLQTLADMIHKYVPDCRVAIGHGQMAPEELEKIIMGFVNYDYDVLLSTTIVENGIDISNANTIIINDAHHFGLSDLHQMRGRVGRSNRKGFCYLLAPPRATLTQDARRRLEALENFSDLGSGFNLAMQDLDIRGAGNLLGAEQSGFMEDLGYETYQKILSQAVTELKNDEFHDLYQDDIRQGKELSGDEFVDDCAIESDLEMYFPDTYVPGSSERMLLYRELDSIEDDNTLATYRQRLIDRFGPVPPEGEELMRVVMLRREGKRLGCERLILKQGMMRMQFVSSQDSPFYQSAVFDRVIHYVMVNPRRCMFKDAHGRRLIQVSQVPGVEEAINVLRGMEKGR